MYLRQAWRDPRLAYKALNPRIPKIRLGDNSWNDIWIPDTFLRNEKAATFHEVTAPNRLMTLTASGELWYVIK
jgi:Neurotransmitter-gated ion-channel ligand binding domain